jgi:demethylmenaquinone methyltransferase/2-methoxy-6-polyprenyl-1,4-benzoquinol methylase
MKDHIGEPQGKRLFTYEMFSHLASRYDFITRALSLCRDAAWKDKLVRALPPLASPNCLDLACGTGDITIRLAEKYRNGRIIAVDLTEGMIDLAKSRNEYDNVTFELKDMCDTQLPEDSFDIVTGGYALRNAPDLKLALAEIHRIMKPGATAAFLDFSKSHNRLCQWAENIFLKTWTSFWGWMIHRDAELYTYIAESLKLYPDRRELKKILEESGFTDIKTKRHYLGILETTICRKA